MLSKAKMVARKYFEKMYDSECDIYENKEVTKKNKSTNYEEVKVYEKQACRLSYSSKNAANPTDNQSNLFMTIKLFISPDIKIKPGSKIIVTNDKGIGHFKSSGIPAVYDTHQEIVLEISEEYA